jgi:glycosyltransferase involved in cell wall biosynthesis
MIAVSIIIPVYNTDTYLPQCFDSVLNQTLRDLEIIVVDDASTDKSMEIIREYEKKDPRIRVISLEQNTPGGVGIPANKGIDTARGEYVGFVDSDDWVKPGLFETLHTLAREKNADFVFCDFFRQDDERNLTLQANDRGHWEQLGSLHDPLTRENTSALLKLSSVPWRKLYKRTFLEKHALRFPEGDFFYEDTPFHYMVTLKAERASYIDTPLYYHRISRPEQTMSGIGKKYFAFLAHGTIIYEFMKKEGLLDHHIRDYFLFIINNFFWVWDRLNPIQRKKFFQSLHESLITTDAHALEEFIHNAEHIDGIRIKAIYNGNFKAYAFIMFKCKTKFGGILRGVDYLLNHTPLEFIKKVKKKFLH